MQAVLINDEWLALMQLLPKSSSKCSSPKATHRQAYTYFKIYLIIYIYIPTEVICLSLDMFGMDLTTALMYVHIYMSVCVLCVCDYVVVGPCLWR